VIKASVARRYAKALFELLDAPSIEPARAGLTGLTRALSESGPLKHVLASPAFGFEQKLAVLSGLTQRLKCPPIINRFLAQLVKMNRVAFLPEIMDAFAALADEAKGTRRVTVTSAVALSTAEQDRLRSRLRDLLRGEVDVTFHRSPELLSGLQIQVGSTVFDSTVRGRLTALRAVLTKE